MQHRLALNCFQLMGIEDPKEKTPLLPVELLKVAVPNCSLVKYTSGCKISQTHHEYMHAQKTLRTHYSPATHNTSLSRENACSEHCTHDTLPYMDNAERAALARQSKYDADINTPSEAPGLHNPEQFKIGPSKSRGGGGLSTKAKVHRINRSAGNRLKILRKRTRTWNKEKNPSLNSLLVS